MHIFFKDKVINLGMIGIVKIVVLIKQQSVLTTLTAFIRKSFYSERETFFPTEIYFSNSSYNALQSSLVIGL